MKYSPFDPERVEARRRRFRAIPVRTLLPNMITLLALCAGLTGIRLAFEDKLDMALAAIVFAAALDGIDGRIARMIKGQSRFGAELDSLADFVNFGCAPGLILYLWGLHDLGNVGWIAAMVFAICGALRLARFNAKIDETEQPHKSAGFLTGVPAPAGAGLAMLPMQSVELAMAEMRFAREKLGMRGGFRQVFTVQHDLGAPGRGDRGKVVAMIAMEDGDPGHASSFQ